MSCAIPGKKFSFSVVGPRGCLNLLSTEHAVHFRTQHQYLGADLFWLGRIESEHVQKAKKRLVLRCYPARP